MGNRVFLCAPDFGQKDLYILAYEWFFYSPLKKNGEKTKGNFQLYEITILFLLEMLNTEKQWSIIHTEFFPAGSQVSERYLRLCLKYLSLLLDDSDMR